MKYEIRLVVRKTDDFNFAFLECIEGNSLIEVLSKLPLLITRADALEKKYIYIHEVDDDIPF